MSRGNGKAAATPTAVLAIWPDTTPANVVASVEGFIRRYCVLPDEAYLAMALWVIATYLARDCFDVFPYLVASSPVPRCGKTRFLEVLELLCLNAWRGIAPSPAALFRMMANCPTLLLDEMETLKPSKNSSETQQAILAVLNAGYKRGSTVPRCEGRNHRVHHHPVYGPKAFATTSRLPSTLSDRSIVLQMQRRSANQRVERFRSSRAKNEAQDVVDTVVSWTAEHDEAVKAECEAMADLEFLNDRDAEIWMPLFTVCKLAVPEHLEELQKSAKKLCASKETDDQDSSLPLRLLADLRAVWRDGEINMATTDILAALRELDESPWRSDIELTPRKLARFLRPFGIQRRTVRTSSTTTFKGYSRAELEKAATRYLQHSDGKGVT
jgi:Protein of unknown function (DUF3631)